MNNKFIELAEKAGSTHKQSLGVYQFFKPELEAYTALLIEQIRDIIAEEYRATPLECCGHFLRLDEAVMKHFYGVEDDNE